MSANIKSLLSYSLIELCRENANRKITVTQLLEVSGVSRQVFYNNFQDLQDLILWTYVHKVQMPLTEKVWAPKVLNYEDYTAGMADILRRCRQYLPFMQFAYRDNSQNCLRIAGAEWVIDAEKKTICHEYHLEAIPPEIDYSVRVLTRGFFDYVGEWVMNGAKDPEPEVLAKYIVGLRFRAYAGLLPDQD